MVSPMTTERDQLAERVGAAVRARRKAKGLSQEAVASEIGISVITLSNIERGENVPSLSVYLRLVQHLDVDTAALAEHQRATRRVNRERVQLEAEATELITSAENRDLRLILTLAKAMQGK